VPSEAPAAREAAGETSPKPEDTESTAESAEEAAPAGGEEEATEPKTPEAEPVAFAIPKDGPERGADIFWERAVLTDRWPEDLLPLPELGKLEYDVSATYMEAMREAQEVLQKLDREVQQIFRKVREMEDHLRECEEVDGVDGVLEEVRRLSEV